MCLPGLKYAYGVVHVLASHYSPVNASLYMGNSMNTVFVPIHGKKPYRAQCLIHFTY